MPNDYPPFNLARGHTFWRNLEKLSSSSKAMDLIAKWREITKPFQAKLVSYRQLSHWEEMGLLRCQREGSTGWRRFNLFESLWLHVLLELRQFGLSLDHIKNVMPFFFEGISSECPIQMVDY